MTKGQFIALGLTGLLCGGTRIAAPGIAAPGIAAPAQ